METCDRRRNLYCTGFVYAYGHYPETYYQDVFYQNRDLHTGIWRHYNMRLELISTFLHFADNETMSNFEGLQKLFKIFPVILHMNNKLQELYLPNQDISIDE
jgi:hypothetical protein